MDAPAASGRLLRVFAVPGGLPQKKECWHLGAKRLPRFFKEYRLCMSSQNLQSKSGAGLEERDSSPEGSPACLPRRFYVSQFDCISNAGHGYEAADVGGSQRLSHGNVDRIKHGHLSCNPAGGALHEPPVACAYAVRNPMRPRRDDGPRRADKGGYPVSYAGTHGRPAPHGHARAHRSHEGVIPC